MPEGVEGEGAEAVAKGKGLLAGVEHVSGHEPRAERGQAGQRALARLSGAVQGDDPGIGQHLGDEAPGFSHASSASRSSSSGLGLAIATMSLIVIARLTAA